MTLNKRPVSDVFLPAAGLTVRPLLITVLIPIS
jgi:hypothetical protein